MVASANCVVHMGLFAGAIVAHMKVVGKVKKYYPRLKDSGLPLQIGAVNYSRQ
jgi:hypothetical protein